MWWQCAQHGRIATAVPFGSHWHQSAHAPGDWIISGEYDSSVAGGIRCLVPGITSLVGRADEIEKVSELLAEYRLVTVTGPGGVGKTRLAAEVIRSVVGRF